MSEKIKIKRYTVEFDMEGKVKEIVLEIHIKRRERTER